MKTLILNVLFATASSIAWGADVPRNLSFHVISKPDVWSTNSELCFSVDNKAECTKVTDMGEIKLRFDGETPAPFQSYVDKLKPADRAFVNKHKEFVVRYLSLEGTRQGRYIIQILQSVRGGSQAIYTYGNYQRPEGEMIQLEPQGYGEASPLNLSLLRSDDQATIRVALDVARAWSLRPVSEPELKRP